MKILLDTSILLWAIAGDKRANGLVDELTTPENQVYFSSASIWEVAIKYGKGRIPIPPEEVLEAAIQQGYTELPITATHSIGVNRLNKPEALNHSDPFDRILLSQAKDAGLLFYTSDEKIAAYDELFIRRI